MTPHTYHDTVGVGRLEREVRTRKANRQEAAILALFRQAPPCFTASPSAVHSRFPEWPLTSVRRAMTNLTARYALEKLDETVPGPYGHAEHVWRLARPVGVGESGRLFA